MEPSTARLLVCDDSDVVRRLLRALLEREGHVVDVAKDGEEAFVLCVENGYDLVVSDVFMGAVSGVQLCRMLRRDPATSTIPIILLTAADDPRSRFWGRNAGADAYLSKDQMQSALLDTIGRLLASRERRTAEAPVRGRRAAPLERLSEVLDELLFEAVIGRDVRHLLDVAQDRTGFTNGLVRLAGEVTRYAYLVITLNGPDGVSHHLHALEPWPERSGELALASLGLERSEGHLLTILDGSTLEGDDALVHVGERVAYPIAKSGQLLGEIVVFGGRKRVAERDRQTIAFIARESVVVANSLFLLEETRRLARTDSLTGLFNRRATEEHLHYEIARAARHDTSVTVALLDIDRFKRVNDEFGHPMGDTVLVNVAEVLQAAVRRVDVVGRWGGEEFLLLLADTAFNGGRIACERVRRRVASLPPEPDGPESVTVSIGMATWNRDESLEALVGRADRALYEAKHGGRNRVVASEET